MIKFFTMPTFCKISEKESLSASESNGSGGADFSPEFFSGASPAEKKESDRKKFSLGAGAMLGILSAHAKTAEKLFRGK
ncbi:MAG: hypothetical protein J6Z34_02375 [Clostridia bacterium]|nr:hypothetical protein [Clostridia bacterium]